MDVNKLKDIAFQGHDLLLLDLDNTLYEYKRCHDYAMQKLSECFSKELNIPPDQFHQLYYQCRKRVHDTHLGTANSHSRLFYIQTMVEKVTGNTNTEVILRLNNAYWDNYLDYMVLYEDAKPFLEKCVEQGITIIMVTDLLAEIQFKKIHKLEIGKYFQFIVTSEEAGVEKPHPFIFELAISKALSIKPGLTKIAVVGDNKKKDIYSSDIYSVDVYHVSENE